MKSRSMKAKPPVRRAASKGLFGAAISALLLGGALLGAPALFGGAPASAQEVEVWKARTCGCCEGWVKHMQASGFAVKVHTVEDVDPVKAANGVPQRLGSCHTAVVGGYVIEGHVPADDVRRLLAERPMAKGLSAPGMPQSSPGMNMPGQPYDVIVFGASGGDKVYAHH
ncbi:DUF411 domain-containing protein [Azospirillum sp. sgz301742]